MTWAAAWAAITKLIPWWVRVALIVALAAATWGAVKMREHDGRQIEDSRQALADYRAEVAQAAALEQAEDARRARASQELVAQLEKRHAQDLADRLARRDAVWGARMRAADEAAGPRAAREPLRLDARSCASDAAAARLGDAFERYRDGIGLALAAYRGRVRDLLRACEADGIRKADALGRLFGVG